MRFELLLLSIAVCCCLMSCSPQVPKNLPKGLYAKFATSMGDFTCVLFEEEAPKTVRNFVGLATGDRPFADPKTGKKVQRPFYDGLTFHRIIKRFMIQGGCPLGAGTGGPGYKFEDEFHPRLRHDQAGRLSMANSGPNTNGSQFFVTTVPTPHLDNRHSIFGQVVDGMDTVQEIEGTKTGRNDRPLTPVVIKQLTIFEVE